MFGNISSIFNYQTELHNVISFSLWGDNPKYTVGAVKNAVLAKKLYPDWNCRYYIGADVSLEVINELKKQDNVSLYLMEDEGSWNGMFWRFFSLSDPKVKKMMSRDCDSRVSLREVAAVNEWIKSDRFSHVMRDHPWHGVPILGGMWGAKGGVIKDIEVRIERWSKTDNYQTDQDFLAKEMWPIFKSLGFVCHDPWFVKIPFPTARINSEFVGEVYDENDIPNEEHREVIRNLEAQLL